MAAPGDLKYRLYEDSVIDPDVSVGFAAQAYRELRGREARHLREDFCGTFCISAAWVRRHEGNTALAVDLDPEPLRYGRAHHLRGLPAAARRRVHVRRGNAIAVTRPPCDVVLVENYSFYALHDWETLVRYFRMARRSLCPRTGALLLCMAGGRGFMEKLRERRVCEGAAGRFEVTWVQRGFEHVTGTGRYEIHYRLAGGLALRPAFVYDWRVWTIPEVRRALAEAGFPRSVVYWEAGDARGRGLQTFRLVERGDDDWRFNAYVVGLR